MRFDFAAMLIHFPASLDLAQPALCIGPQYRRVLFTHHLRIDGQLKAEQHILNPLVVVCGAHRLVNGLRHQAQGAAPAVPLCLRLGRALTLRYPEENRETLGGDVQRAALAGKPRYSEACL